MRISFSASCKQVQPLMNFPRGINMDHFIPRSRKDKVVIVMGATGTGKSRLSIDLATKFPADIVNCDKMQVYKGLDIVTNKVTQEECGGVPHHLLGFIDHPSVDFTATDFQHHASLAVESIVMRDRLPIIAGGSNSFIRALIHDNIEFQSRYECCFLWVDVALPVLHLFVSKRVNEMIQAGLVDEVRDFFDPNASYKHGLRRAIGVPEMDQFLRYEHIVKDETRARLLDEAIDNIKSNTRKLASTQVQNIVRLENLLEWDMHRLDATQAFLKCGYESDEAWDRLVVKPSTSIVDQFFYKQDFVSRVAKPTPVTKVAAMTIGQTVASHAMAAVIH